MHPVMKKVQNTYKIFLLWRSENLCPRNTFDEAVLPAPYATSTPSATRLRVNPDADIVDIVRHRLARLTSKMRMEYLS